MKNKYENYDTWVNNNGYDGDNSDKYDDMMRDVELNDDCCAQKVQKKGKGNVKGHQKGENMTPNIGW